MSRPKYRVIFKCTIIQILLYFTIVLSYYKCANKWINTFCTAAVAHWTLNWKKIELIKNNIFYGALTILRVWPPLSCFLFTLIGHITFGKPSLDEWSAWRRDVYLTTQWVCIQNKQTDRQTVMSPEELESIISAGERPKTLDRAVIGIRQKSKWLLKNVVPYCNLKLNSDIAL
jgi:hypothetical protein